MDFKNLMKQAQEMQAKMQQAQKEIEALEVNGEAGGGAVVVTMNGKHKVRRVVLDPAILTEDKEILEDLIASAVNKATDEVEKNSKDKLASLSAGLKLPQGFGDMGGMGS